MTKAYLTKQKYCYYPTVDGQADGKTNSITWIRYDRGENMMCCNVCLEYESIADKISSLFIGCSNRKVAPLKSYHNTTKHEKCVKAKLASLFPKQQHLPLLLTKLSKEKKEKLLPLFNTAFFMVKENKGFRKFPGLMRLQEKNKLPISEKLY